MDISTIGLDLAKNVCLQQVFTEPRVTDIEREAERLQLGR